MKAYTRSLLRLFKNHIIRFFSISAIFVVAVGFLSGIGDSATSINETEYKIYNDGNIHDAIIMGTETNPLKMMQVMSLTYKELDENKDKYGIDKIEKVISQDIEKIDGTSEDGVYRYSYFDVNSRTIDKLKLEKGRMPTAEYEVVAEHSTKDIREVEIGSKFIEPTTNKECTVVGVVSNAAIFSTSKEKSLIQLENDKEDTKSLNYIYYINNTTLVNKTFNQLFVTFKDRSNIPFSDPYEKKVDTFKNQISGLTVEISGIVNELGKSLKTLTLNENYSFRVIDGFCDKINSVAMFFIVIFVAVLLLMVYSTMSRLLDEERPSIATLKTLGYSNFLISLRYIIFFVLAAIVGIGIATGPAILVNYVVLNAMNYQIIVKEKVLSILGIYFALIAILSFIGSVVMVAITNHFVIKKKPAELLVAKTPKFGKRILLEKIKFIWNKLSFKYKSTMRNIFLFKSRLIMTVLSIILSSAMVFVSFSMLSNSLIKEGQSLVIISIVVLIFSGILSALIVYNITNINISERKREIATLKVLGYNDGETCGYIFREIAITVIMSALIGLPVAVGISYWILTVTDIGTLNNVSWYWYVLTPISTVLFAIISMVLFRPKIIKLDMNDSLKTLE